MKSKAILAIAATVLSINSAQASMYVMCHTNSVTLTHSAAPQTVRIDYQTSITNNTTKAANYHIEYQFSLDYDLVYNTYRDVVLKPGQSLNETVPYEYIHAFTTKHNYDAPCSHSIRSYETNEDVHISGGGYVNVV